MIFFIFVNCNQVKYLSYVLQGAHTKQLIVEREVPHSSSSITSIELIVNLYSFSNGFNIALTLFWVINIYSMVFMIGRNMSGTESLLE